MIISYLPKDVFIASEIKPFDLYITHVGTDQVQTVTLIRSNNRDSLTLPESCEYHYHYNIFQIIYI